MPIIIPSAIGGQATASGTSAGKTASYLQRFDVPFEFPVIFTNGLWSTSNDVLVETLCRLEPGRRHRCIVFVDEGLTLVRPTLSAEIGAYADHHRSRMTLVAAPVIAPGGEKIKNDLHFIESMQRMLMDLRIDRHSFVIAIGGGAFLDAVGLVAATTHRGIRHIRMPTTVLSQNDSGVGVKNGVNLQGVKNFVGTFAPPFAVLNDLDFIDVLPARDKIAGMAEAVKVALIRDGEFFAWLEAHADDLVLFERNAMAYMIQHCARLHMRQIGQGGDPFETGSARPLDFGHWAAHRLETLTHYHLRHGEAVAIGIALDTHYSVLAGMLDAESGSRIIALLEHLGFKLWHPALEKRNTDGELAILAGLREFREHLGGELCITLLTAVGTGVEVNHIDEDKIVEAITWLKARTR